MSIREDLQKVPIPNSENKAENLYKRIDTSYENGLAEPDYYIGGANRFENVIEVLEGRHGEFKIFKYINGSRQTSISEENIDVGEYLEDNLIPSNEAQYGKLVDQIASFETETDDNCLMTGYVMTGLEYNQGDHMPWPLLAEAITYSEPDMTTKASIKTQEPFTL